MSTLVSIRNLHKTYQRGPEKVDVLKGIDLDIDKGDFVALMGPSGSGKTTLLNLIGGLDSPSTGQIEVAGQRIDAMKSGCVQALVSQKPFGMTAQALDVLKQMHDGTFTQADGFSIDTGVVVVLPDTLDAFLNEGPH